MSASDARVTLSVYAADRDWLQQRQRLLGADRRSWVTMADLVHELLMAIAASEEEA